MKVLPRKIDINKAQANERKIQIDEGVNLAKKIDFLRETALKEEKNLLEWRTNNINKVKAEIEDYIIVRDNLQKQTEAAEVYRKELLAPLDEEWKEINKAKEDLKQEKQNIYLLREQQKEERKEIDKEIGKIKNIATDIGKKHNEAEKAKAEAISLRDLAQREYEVAKEERSTQTEAHEKALSEANQTKREYEVALTTIEVRENEVKEKESELLKDKKHLESQQEQFRKVIERNEHGTNNNTHK